VDILSFEYTNNDNELTNESMEDSVKRIHYQYYDEWIQNFALNLDNIWNEHSAKDLASLPSNLKNKQNSAIVIGKGPSVDKNKHLELLAESNYKGNIICCDGKLKDALTKGVTPDKFPNFFVVTIDPYDWTKQNYENKIINEFGSKINGIFTTISNPLTVQQARSTGIKIHWMHSLFDLNEGKKSFNYISSIMTRSKKQTRGLPAIQTGGNVGTSSWFVAWKILKCSIVSLIGINHGWEEDDPFDKIVKHGRNDVSFDIKEDSDEFKKLFPKIFNSELNKFCILDPLFQFYSNALKEFILRSPDWVNTINSTEGGSIFGERIQQMPFVEFLKYYKT
jgi:hypothetical protein